MATSEEIVLAKLKLTAKESRLDNLQIEYWIGGGQPPPYYRSEQFRLISAGGTPQMEFSVLRFCNGLTPNEVTELFILAADPPDIQSLAKLLLDKRVFEVRFPEETDPKIGGSLSREITVKAGVDELKRTYYRAMPQALADVEQLIEKLIERTKARGKHSWIHKGKPIEDPFAGSAR